jgi:hypothetical protein
MLTEEQKIMFEASDKILEIIDNPDLPRGDLQGVIEAIILSIIYEVKKL